MGGFSTTLTVGQVCLPCQNGNIFYLGNPDGVSCPPIKGFVNSQAVGPLPMCQAVTDKTQETSGAIELEIEGKKYPLIKNINDYGQCNLPNQIQVNIGIAEPPLMSRASTSDNVWTPPASTSYVPVGQVSSMRPNGTYGLIPQGYETNALDVIGDQNAQFGNYSKSYQQAEDHMDVIVLEAGNSNLVPSDGEYNSENASPAIIAWMCEEVGSFFADDEKTRIVKMAGGQLIKIGFLAREKDNLAFMRKEGMTKFYVKRINGKPNIILKGAPGLRNILKGTRYTIGALENRTVSVMNAAARSVGGNIASGAKSLAKTAGAVGLIFVCAVDTLKYFSQPAGERDLSDLIVSLGFNAVKAVLSGITGTIAAGFVIVLAGTAGAPIVIAVAAGLAAAFAVGWVANKLIEATGFEESMKEAINNSQASSKIRSEMQQSIRW